MDGVSVTGRFLAALASRPDLRSRVSQIDVSDPRDVIVLLDDDPALLHVGDSRFAERLTTYFQIASRIRDEWNEIDYVDLRLDDVERVIVRAKTAPGIEGARTRSK
jgi:cell division septal protein FtsQ